MSLLTAEIAKITVGSSSTLPNSQWTIKQMANVAKLHNARDGVVRKATLKDAEGTADLFYDDAMPPDTTFANGATLTAKFYIDATHFYTGSIIISDVTITAPGVEGEPIRVQFNWALASGTLTPPTFS